MAQNACQEQSRMIKNGKKWIIMSLYDSLRPLGLASCCVLLTYPLLTENGKSLPSLLHLHMLPMEIHSYSSLTPINRWSIMIHFEPCYTYTPSPYKPHPTNHINLKCIPPQSLVNKTQDFVHSFWSLFISIPRSSNRCHTAGNPHGIIDAQQRVNPLGIIVTCEIVHWASCISLYIFDLVAIYDLLCGVWYRLVGIYELRSVKVRLQAVTPICFINHMLCPPEWKLRRRLLLHYLFSQYYEVVTQRF